MYLFYACPVPSLCHSHENGNLSLFCHSRFPLCHSRFPLCHSRFPLCHSRESGNLSFLSDFVGVEFIRPVLIAGSINQAPTLTGGTPVLRFRAYVIHPSSFPISIRHCEHRFWCVAIPSKANVILFLSVIPASPMSFPLPYVIPAKAGIYPSSVIVNSQQEYGNPKQGKCYINSLLILT